MGLRGSRRDRTRVFAEHRDVDLIERAYPNAVALYKPTQVLLQTATGQAWATGQPAEWANETHRVATEAVYLFPATREIDERYVEKALPVIHEQLPKAAVRLAWVLNRALERT
jgi:hypothetical protein